MMDGGPASRYSMQLPVIDDSQIPSYGIARRATSLVLLTLAAFAVLGVIASLLTEMSLTVDAAGITEQRDVWPVRVQQSGVLSEILVGPGDTVRRGQVVARLDSAETSYARRVMQSQLMGGKVDLRRATLAALNSAQLQSEKIAEAEARVIRARAIIREQIVDMTASRNADSALRAYVPGTSTRMDVALADVRSAESGLRAARIGLELAKVDSTDLERRRVELSKLRGDVAQSSERLARDQITAPADGIVLTDQLQRLLGSQVQAGEEILEIADAVGWRAVLSVRERDVHDVRVGQPATLELPSLKQLDGRRIRARVASVAEQPTPATPGGLAMGPMYRVVVALNSSELPVLEGDLRRGYLVQGRIVTRRDRIAALAIAYLRERITGFR